jgi:anti-sigma regulatory factor (Ser/Thr protein kinase)
MGEIGLNGLTGRTPEGTGPREVSRTFGRDTVRIAEARGFAAEYLAETQRDRDRPLPPGATGTVQLVVSELVTNAVKYGAGPVELVLARTGDLLSVTVRDGGSTLPVPRPADPGRVGQHGLEIVAALCQDVDIRREPTGKRVTARIALGGPAA